MTVRVTKRANSAQRQPQILKKAARLFQLKGYAAVSMDELAAALKLNKATIYYHFPGGKSDLLYAINVIALDELQSRSEKLSTEGTAADRLRAVMRAMVDLQVEIPDSVIVYHEESRWLKRALKPTQYREVRKREARFRELVEAIVDDGIHDGSFEPMDSRKVALTIINMVSSGYRTIHSLADVDAASLSRLQADLVLRGLEARPAAR